MMKQSLLPFICLLVIFIAPKVLYSQETPKDSLKLYVVKTNDDNEYVGSIVSQNAMFLVLKTANLGEITIQKKNIRSIKPLEEEQIVGGEYWFENPHTTRYFFGSSGYSLRRGEGYYQNTWIFLNQVSYGATDNITIGAGMIPLFIFAGEASPVWITPKVSFPIVKNKVNFGTGAFLGAVIGEEDSGFGLLYANTTFGPRDRNISVGLGYGFVDGEWSNTPAISVSGMVRTGKKFAFMMENYFVDTGDENVALSLIGGRFIGRSIAVDGALVIPVSELDEGFIAIPWLGINVPFGGRK